MPRGTVNARATRPERRRPRPVLGAAVVALASLRAMGAVAHPDDDPKAAAVKAAFVYNFAKFATWPARRFLSPSAPVILCVRGGDLEWRALRPLTEKQIGEHPVEVRVLDADVPVDACHIFFSSEFASGGSLRDALATASRYAVLMVSDMPGVASLGGQIGLVQDHNRLRFQVNLDSVTRTGVKLSSKLLQLAEIVGPASQ
jgi:hypothetical protein